MGRPLERQMIKHEMTRWMGLGVATAAAAMCFAQGSPGAGPHAGGQSVADAIRSAASADLAFVAAGLLKNSNSGDLAALLQYPGDDVMVVTLTGAKVRQAIERSVSGYPSESPSFLQLSGANVTFRPSSPANSRVVSISVNGAALSDSATYSVAMPSSLALGGSGYFKIWDRPDVTRELKTTVEAVVRGKTVSPSAPRYTVAD